MNIIGFIMPLSHNIQLIILYLRLMRIHRPLPILLLILPPLILVCAEYYRHLNDFNLLTMILKIIIGGFCARSIGCVINDVLDRDIDQKSERTKNRPLVKVGLQPSKMGIIILLLILSIISLAIIFTLKPIAIILSLITALMIAIYPLMKRFFLLPQLFLGLTYNMGILIIGYEISSKITVAYLVFYIANALLTLAYDTVYAAQDEIDDQKNHVKSSILTFGKNWDKIIDKIYNFSFILYAIFGFLSSLNFGYYIALMIAFLLTKYLLSKIDKKDFTSLQKFFDYNTLIMFIILSGIIIDIVVYIVFSSTSNIKL